MSPCVCGTCKVNRLQIMGNRIYVTGRFTHTGGVPAPGFAVWEMAP